MADWRYRLAAPQIPDTFISRYFRPGRVSNSRAVLCRSRSHDQSTLPETRSFIVPRVTQTCKSPEADPGLWLNWSWRCSAESPLWLCWGQRSLAWSSHDRQAAWQILQEECHTGSVAEPGGTADSPQWSWKGSCRNQTQVAFRIISHNWFSQM